MEKLIGCSKDHSKEIDLYDKTYVDKIDRVQKMMQQAYSALEEYLGMQEPEEDVQSEGEEGDTTKADNL